MSHQELLDRRDHERRALDRRFHVLFGLATISAVVAIASAVVVLFVGKTVLSNRDDVVRSVCAIADYGDSQVASARKNLDRVPPAQLKRANESIESLHQLVVNMRATGINCRTAHGGR